MIRRSLEIRRKTFRTPFETRAASGQDVSTSTQSTLQLSYASAADLASQNPQHASEIISAARTSFLDGDQWAYTAGLVAVLIGAALVFFLFPRKERESELHAEFHEQDTRQVV